MPGGLPRAEPLKGLHMATVQENWESAQAATRAEDDGYRLGRPQPTATVDRADEARRIEQVTLRDTHFRGRRMWLVMIGVWPVAAVIGLIGGLAFDGGLAVWIGSALGFALGLDFFLAVIAAEVDDGEAS